MMANDNEKRETTYSPVNRYRHRSQQGREKEEETKSQRKFERDQRLSTVNHLTQAKLRYLDDEDLNDEDDGSHLHRGNRQGIQFEKCTSKNKRPITVKQGLENKSKIIPDKTNHKFLSDFDGVDNGLPELFGVNHSRQVDEDTSSLEEVYLCTCCGITRQLNPAMKYMSVFKSLFLLFNLLVFAFGLANFGMGLWFRIDPKVYEIHKYIETQNFTLAGWILLVTGFIACTMALLAATTSSKHSICLLMFYSITMTLLTISCIGSLVLLTVYGFGASLERFMVKEIYEQIRRRTMSTELDLMTSSDAAQFLDFIQVKLRCCGAQDFRDYQKLGMVITTTCYTIAGNYINAPGCGKALRELFDVRAGLAAGFAFGSVLVQIVTIVLASLMICSIYNWRANPRPASAASYSRSSTSGQLKINNNVHNRDSQKFAGYAGQYPRPLSCSPSIEV